MRTDLRARAREADLLDDPVLPDASTSRIGPRRLRRRRSVRANGSATDCWYTQQSVVYMSRSDQREELDQLATDLSSSDHPA